MGSIGMTLAGIVNLVIYGTANAHYGTNHINILIGAFSVILVLGLINITFFSFLVHGTANNHPGFVRAWLIFVYIFIGIDLLMILVSCILSFNFFSLIVSVPALIIKLYLVSVVRSFHISLKNEESNLAPEIPVKSNVNLEFNNKMAEYPPSNTV